MPGAFSIRIRARGETAHGRPFERERTLTAAAVPGGDIWNPNEPRTSDLCNLLHCFRGKGGISGEFAQKLKELGIDLPAFLKCLEEQCRPAGDQFEMRQPQKPHEPAVAQLAGLSLGRLVELIAERLGDKMR